ncbi:MAG: gas vesicle protein GvpN [Deltaproteobacteria bacterium CG12_big_fil_rev_8_21_14_0_65_43_10]|nr:MAG: gas vesicle protein GvpN [Deltaproteobacteria bacterium CG12_big_fil_rev_8_21_14_0_65_43_10]
MAKRDNITVLEPCSLPNFVETPFVKDITERAMAYVAAGFPIHFRGGSGTGKTTLAMHVAAMIGRPVVMIHGDEEFSTSDLVGGEYGYRSRKVVDNFIHTVLKTEEDMQKRWVDNRLTIACKNGFTLIYDEFTRSRPEANNILLSVLQERMLDLPVASHHDGNYLSVHPDFTSIFTSNPEEYAGVHRSQDALRDRMITLDLDHFDEETEVRITESKSGLANADAARIIKIVRGLRDSDSYEFAPTIRGCIMIAKTLAVRHASVDKDDPVFRQICMDILSSETSRIGTVSSQSRTREVILELIDQVCQGENGGGKRKTKTFPGLVHKDTAAL